MELTRYGFVQAGRWRLSERTRSGITFELERLADRRVVYAFVIGEDIKYIGICEKDTTTLKDRMGRYRSLTGRGRATPGGENVNQHKARLIRERLEAGKEVLIFALEPASDSRYVDLDIDLVKGLENPLIEKLKPAWNR